MLEIKGLNNVLPNIGQLDDGVQVYRKFYKKEVEDQHGVLAITLELIR